MPSACGVSVSVSVALLLPGVGSVTLPGGATVAVMASEPVADLTGVGVQDAALADLVVMEAERRGLGRVLEA